ncbi:zinc finger protein 62-like [Mercenaria mercenaria]|uniref:zinc finger protein 62-like n=1 Tax=Mercenaria mercenaria TaxID=6596 RepID=UPI00234F03FB|nr:zinc finger protein 62-like [Mercenaria mercenaria]XP_045179411.2 zinc finger protein 62-like [Mercenaria mercenaria]
MDTKKATDNENVAKCQEGMFICRLCRKIFETAIKLRIHMFSHCAKLRTKCIYCQHNFKDWRHLITHMESIHQMTLEDIVDCIEKQNVHKTREDETENELDENSMQCLCNLCGQRFYSRKILLDHMRKTHPQKQQYFCGICQKGFAHSWPLKLHLNSHSNVRYDCTICGRSFLQKRSLRNHMKYHTITGNIDSTGSSMDKTEGKRFDHVEGENNCNENIAKKQHFACEVCCRVFANSEFLEKHISSYGKRHYNCKICGKSFHCEQTMRKHKKSHTSKEYDGCAEKNKASEVGIPPDHVKKNTCNKKVVKSIEEDNVDLSSVKSKECDEKACKVEGTTTGTVLNQVKKDYGNENVERNIEEDNLDLLSMRSKESNGTVHKIKNTAVEIPLDNIAKDDGNEKIERHFEEDNLDSFSVRSREPNDVTHVGKREDTTIRIPPDHVKKDDCNEKNCEEDDFDLFFKKDKNLYTCFHCNQVYSAFQRLENHIKTHWDVKPYRCQICGTTFRNARNCKRHTRIHIRGLLYTCDKCGESFQLHKFLKEHIKDVHGEMSVTCKFCRKVFTREALKEHMKMHGKKDITCRICSKSFIRLDKLYSHMAIHSDERSHKCDMCSKTYKSYTDLRHHHRKVHTNQRKYRQCDVCGKSVASNSLRQHMKSHTDVKTFQCEVCSKFFKMKHQLKSHLLTHDDSREHICEICGFRCKWAHILRNHLKTKHKSKGSKTDRKAVIK